jgi:hypothetical protein
MSLAKDASVELERAKAARSAGNEGLARVCARRAAGLAARGFLNRNKVPPFDAAQGILSRSISAYAALKALAAFPAISPQLKLAAVHLTMRVNDEFDLPHGTDLIDEAHKIIGGLK